MVAVEDDKLKGIYYNSIFNNPRWGVVVTGEDLETIMGFSPGAEHIFGVSAEEIIGKNVRDLYKNPERRKALMEKLLRDGSLNDEDEFRRHPGRPDEKIINITFSLDLLKDGKGKNIGTLGMVRDITEKRRIEAEKRRIDLERKEYLTGIKNLLYYELERYDPATADHTQRVSLLCEKVGRLMGMGEEDIEKMSIAIGVHDIGKKELEREVLVNGRAYLRESDEMEYIRSHTTRGEEILLPLGLPKDVIDVVKHHHERYDGKGYPDGIAGEDTPLYPRIVAIADAYDSMVEGRPYKLSMDKETAVEELKRCSGMDFDRGKIMAYNRRALQDAVKRAANGLADREGVGNIPIMIAKEFSNLKERGVDDINSALSDYKMQFSHPNEIAEFLDFIEINVKKYLAERVQKELQFDPKIAEFFIRFLKSTDNPLR